MIKICDNMCILNVDQNDMDQHFDKDFINQ